MPIAFLTQVFDEGLYSIPLVPTIISYLPWIVVVGLLKWYFGGAVNKSERNMHGKVVMMTGGTSGIGAEVARELAQRGAQLVLLTHHALSDPFVADYILDLRTRTKNQLITAEHVDLSSLHAIRQFATKWVDNAPPRRLDTIILCANNFTPEGNHMVYNEDGLEYDLALNYVANFHLLSILSPALRAQPADRDVRVIFGTCSSYMGGQLPNFANFIRPPDNETPKAKKEKDKAKKGDPMAGYDSTPYQTSKLSLMIFASAFQKHLSSYTRPDKLPSNARVFMVDPGWSRTPGMRRYITNGSLFGLLIYLITWPLWWLILKSPQQGAQTFLFAAMEGALGKTEGGLILKECRQVSTAVKGIMDEGIQKKLWESSEKTVETLEKQSALKRAEKKKAPSSAQQ